VVLTPTASTSNDVDVTSGGCTKTFSGPIIVAPTPTISILSVTNPTICAGLSSVITPTGATTFTLINTGTSGTSFTVNPTANTTYTIYGSSGAACNSNTINTNNNCFKFGNM
jgi:hypothetical protein